MRYLPSSAWGALPILLLGDMTCVKATLYVGADVSRSCATYFSKFGKSIDDPDGSIVKAQDIPGNEFLCSSNFQNFHGHMMLSGNHLAIVASEGNCTLQQKVLMTESLAMQNAAISTLIFVSSSPLLPKDLDELLQESRPEHCRSPGDLGCDFHTNLTVVSITKSCGDHLLDYIHQQSEFTIADGGPALFLLDSQPQAYSNETILNVTMVMMMFVFISVAAVHRLFGPRPASDDATRPAQSVLLTEECVECFHCPHAAKELVENMRDDEPPSCAVCIECIDLTSKVTVLPCGHHFHHSCILPWLTERQANCPLCKYNLQPLKLEAPAVNFIAQAWRLDRQLFCQQWSRFFPSLDRRESEEVEETSNSHDYGGLELELELS